MLPLLVLCYSSSEEVKLNEENEPEDPNFMTKLRDSDVLKDLPKDIAKKAMPFVVPSVVHDCCGATLKNLSWWLPQQQPTGSRSYMMSPSLICISSLSLCTSINKVASLSLYAYEKMVAEAAMVMKQDVKERGREALELELPFDEAGMLTELLEVMCLP